MKIDKLKPSHWVFLALFGLNVLLARALRRWRHRPGRKLVLLYGHKLNGNLLAIYRAHRTLERGEMELVFLTMDPAYYRELMSQGYACRLALHPSCISALADADAIVSDHGLHVLEFLLGARGLRFFDVWHGIPFKGFDADDFRVQQQYDEIWVASERHRQLYLEQYGFPADKVIVTGYARTDRLVTASDDMTKLQGTYGIPRGRRTILFAPTWAQDDKGRNIFPFDSSESDFLEALSEFAEAHYAVVLLRSHLNTGEASARHYRHVIPLSGSRFPDTEEILLISDVLVCDWSSIAFDYLLLDRPTIFLDVPVPFRKGFSLGPEYRYGAVVGDMSSLHASLIEALLEPERYWQSQASRHREVKNAVYGSTADGQAAQRCLNRL